MIRNLKVLLLAAMALTAFGALNAAGAHAAEEKFHCSVEPCRVRVGPDGTGATAHHVFVVSDTRGHSLSFTCPNVTGEANSATKTTTELRLENIVYPTTCTVNGSGVVHVRMNGCTFLFRSTGGGTVAGAEVHVECPGVPHIEIEITNAGGATLCTLLVTPQTLASGVKYHNIVGPPRELTVEVNVPGIVVEPTAGDTLAGCQIDPSEPWTGKYTTGNTIATGETNAGVMAEAWFE